MRSDEDTAENVRPRVIGSDPHRRLPGQRIAVGTARLIERRQQIDLRIAREGVGDASSVQALAPDRSRGPCTAVAIDAGRLRGQPHEADRVVHHLRIRHAGAIPFEHGEFGRMQGTRFPVAIDLGEAEEALFARGQKLLCGKFRRGVKVARLAAAIGHDPVGREGMEMRLIAGRNLKRPAIGLDEILRSKTSRG